MRGKINALLAAVCIALAITVTVQAVSPFRGTPHYQHADQTADASQEQEPYLRTIWRWTTHDPVAFYTSLLALFNLVLAVSTIGLWIVTYLTLRHARQDAARQASDMRNSIRASLEIADAARRAIGPAMRSNEIMSDTAERELRAYVGTSKAYFLAFSPESPILVRVEIQNFGRTPAHNYQTSIYLAVGAADGSTPFAQKDLKEEGGESLMPGNLSVVVCELSLGSTETAAACIDAIKKSELALYVIGRIEYRDVFGNRRFTMVKRIAHGQRSTSNAPFINPDTGNEST